MNFLQKASNMLTIDTLRKQVLLNAYGNSNSTIARIDPRTLLVWSLFFGTVPWFIHDIFLLVGILALVSVTTFLARIAPMVFFLFILGVITQAGYLLVFIFIFGGSITSFLPVLTLTIKIMIASLASITAFSGLDPDDIATGLIFFGFPAQLSFSVSFSYRILPLMLEELDAIILSHRIRRRIPEGKGVKVFFAALVSFFKIMVLSFYPLILNTAKRARTTVEALELKGYRRSLSCPKVRKLTLARLQLTNTDLIFINGTIIYLCILFASRIIFFRSFFV